MSVKITGKTVKIKEKGDGDMAKMEFGELDQYLFGQATHYDIYKKLGAHPVTQNGKSGTYFCSLGTERRGCFCCRRV